MMFGWRSIDGNLMLGETRDGDLQLQVRIGDSETLSSSPFLAGKDEIKDLAVELLFHFAPDLIVLEPADVVTIGGKHYTAVERD